MMPGKLPQRAAQINAVVAGVYQLTPDILRERGREERLVRPRQVAMYLVRELTQASLAAIGHMYGRHHTTVLHSVQLVRAAIVADTKFAATVILIRDAIKNQSALPVRPRQQRTRLETVERRLLVLEAEVVTLRRALLAREES